jgi:MFS family permease
MNSRSTAENNVRTLNLFNLIDSFIMLWPIIILYYIKVGGSVASSGILLSILTISMSFFEIPLGAFSDRFGRAKTTQIGSIVNVVAFSLIALSWYTGFFVLAAGVLLQGFSMAAYSGNNESLLYDSSSKTDKHFLDHLANYSKLAYYASGVSAILGGIIASKSFFAVAILSLIPRILCAFLAFMLKDIHSLNTEDKYIILIKNGFREVKKSSKLRSFTTAEIIAGVFREASWQYRSVFIQMVWPVWAIGFSSALDNIISGFATSKSRKIITKMGGVYKSIYKGMLFDRVIQIVAVLLQGAVSPILMGASSIFGAASDLSIRSEKQELIPDRERATVNSIISFISSLVFAGFVIPFGYMIDRFGVRASLVASLSLIILSLPFYLKSFRDLKNKKGL